MRSAPGKPRIRRAAQNVARIGPGGARSPEPDVRRRLLTRNLGEATTMKFRFAVPLTLALFITLPALAQRPGGEHPEGVHTNQGHIPQAPPKREAHAKPEIDRREAVASITSRTWPKITGMDMIVRTTGGMFSLTRSSAATLNTLAPLTLTTSSASIVIIASSDSLAVFRLRLRRGTGPLPPNGAGIATATALSCTTIPIILAGIFCITRIPAGMSMWTTWDLSRHLPTSNRANAA